MFKMKKDEQNGNILCLRDIIRFRIMFTIFKFLYPTRIKWERKKRCTLPKPSGSKKSGVPYQTKVGAKKESGQFNFGLTALQYVEAFKCTTEI